MKLEHITLAALTVLSSKIASEWAPAEYFSPSAAIAWIDGRCRSNQPIELNTFFDRVVAIYLNKKATKATNRTRFHQVSGVLITNQLVLTSFNAFRALATNTRLNNMRVFILTTRFLDPNTGRTIEYNVDNDLNIKCARQVIPSRAYETWPEDMQHGPHSPLHDLMVLRLERPITFARPIPPALIQFSDKNWDKKNTTQSKIKVPQTFGPILTVLAKPGQTMFMQEMMFASLGHLNEDHILDGRYLEAGKFGEFEDCEEWIPKQWGRFICLRNEENYPGLASGAMLFSDTTLFGVGAFVLRKGVGNILVFTDVRPYEHLLNRTCTVNDQALKNP